MAARNNTLDDIASVIGMTPTLVLAAWYGGSASGSSLFVPERVEEGQVLVKLIGRSAAERMAAAFPGEHLAVPRPVAYQNELRRSQIATLLTNKFTTRQVASFLEMSEKRVQQICRELEVEGLIAPVGGPPKNSKLDGRGGVPRG